MGQTSDTYGNFFARVSPRYSEVKLCSSLAGLDGAHWQLKCIRPENPFDIPRILSERVYHYRNENLFFDPRVIEAGFGRIAHARPHLFWVTERYGDQEKVRLHFPATSSKIGIGSQVAWRTWSHPFAPLGVPSFDKVDLEIISNFIQLVEKYQDSGSRLFWFPDIPKEGEFSRYLSQVCSETGLPIASVDSGSRGILRSFQSDGKTLPGVKSKKIRQLNRQLRRLGEMGDLKFEIVHQVPDIMLRFEEFLLLEARGWKGQNGTTLYALKHTAAFSRQSVTSMADQGQCSILSLRLADVAIAGLVVFHKNGTYYPWKIAHNPDFEKYSPGTLLFWKASHYFASQDDFKIADSLAAPNSALVNPLWKNRQTMQSLVMGTSKRDKGSVEKAARQLEFLRNSKQMLKTLLRRN